MLKTILLTLTGLMLAMPGTMTAADRYASPSGSSSGDGSISRPWDLYTALRNARAGDTVWLRGGTYNGTFECWISGTASAPIIYRQYPGERARINGGSTRRPALWVFGNHLWFWGFEIYYSDTGRHSSETGSFPSDIKRDMSFYGSQNAGQGQNVKYINLVVHDTRGSGLVKESLNAEVYGSIMYYDGWDASDRGHGHGLYPQNSAASTFRIEDNIMFNAHAYGLHAYGSGDAVNNFHVEGNVAFNNGSLARSGYSGNFLMYSSSPIKNIVFKNNFSYYSPERSGGTNELGNGNSCQNTTVTGNYLVAERGVALRMPVCRPSQMSGNTFVGRLDGFSSSLFPSNTYMTSKPTKTQVFVRPNRYEQGRANIIVYNWEMYGSVGVNVSSVLKDGDKYEIRDVQDFFGRPVVEGTYYGGNINIPMNSVSVSPTVGNVSVAPRHTSTEFGVFVLLRTGAGAPTNPNTAPRVNAGPDQNVSALSSTLSGQVTDDGMPSNSLSMSWSKASGPGTVSFGKANAASTSVTFSTAGTYVLRLTASDSALTASDTVTITVTSGSSTGDKFVGTLEAESATLASPMTILDAASVRHVATQTASRGTATFRVTVPAAGTYVMWGRVKAANPDSDSFFVSVNGGAEDIYDTAEGKWSVNWQWTQVNGRNGGLPNAIPVRTFTLQQGVNVIVFRGRDPNSALDKIVVTNNLSYRPQ